MDEDVIPTTPNHEQLSGVAVVIIMGICVQTIIILIIFAKRQIMRFTLRSRRGPHVSVGQGGLKHLRKEIDRRIEYASHITTEPRLIQQQISNPQLEMNNIRFRVEAVSRIEELDCLLGSYSPEYMRPPGANIRSFLIECLAGPLCGLEPKQIHVFCDVYEHARHHYAPFLQPQLAEFNAAFQILKAQIEDNTKTRPETPKKGLGTPLNRRTKNRPRRRLPQTQSDDDLQQGQQNQKSETECTTRDMNTRDTVVIVQTNNDSSTVIKSRHTSANQTLV